jgi:hypothetical protein
MIPHILKSVHNFVMATKHWQSSRPFSEMIGFLFAFLLTILQSTPSCASNGLRRRNELVSSNVVVQYFSPFSKFLTIAHPFLSWQSGPQTRIIGGEDVDEARYPYFAMMWGGSVCGGVLIAPDLVVSAAHVRFRQWKFFGRSINAQAHRRLSVLFDILVQVNTIVLLYFFIILISIGITHIFVVRSTVGLPMILVLVDTAEIVGRTTARKALRLGRN